MDYPIVGPAYTGRIREIGWDECTNLYMERTETVHAKYEDSLLGTPGTIDIPSWVFPLQDGIAPVIRGMYTTSRDNWLIVVAGNSVYRMPDVETNTPILMSTLSKLQTKVSMVDDGRYLSIADGRELWVADLNFPANAMTTPVSGMVRPNSVAFIGGYTIINNCWNDPDVEFPPTSNLVYYSNIYNASKWNVTYAGQPNDPKALRYFAAEGSADPVLKIQRVGDSLWLLGRRSYEIHMLSENQDKPFSRVGGSLTDVGIYAADSCAVIGDTAYFLGMTAHGGTIVYKTQGYDVIRISNHAVEYDISHNANPTQAIGWTYEMEGHKFYILSFSGSNLTVCYDEEINGWHTRSSRMQLTDEQTCWEPIYAASRGGRTYVGSTLYPRIFVLDPDKYDEWDGRPIKRVRSGPIVWDDLRRIRHNSLQLDLHTGGAKLNGTSAETDPQVMMQYSDDNGHTWSNEYWCSLGKVGLYKTRAIWRRLGMAYSRIYKVTITAPIAVEIVGASILTDSAPRK